VISAAWIMFGVGVLFTGLSVYFEVKRRRADRAWQETVPMSGRDA
jgi:hypothetical protein